MNKKSSSLFSALLCAIVNSSTLADTHLSPEDKIAAFKAAGFQKQEADWKSNCDDSSDLYAPAAIDTTRDINYDGLPEVVVTEVSSFCYGNTGIKSNLVSKKPDGSWSLAFSSIGVLRVVASSKKEHWTDIEVGGPGFCFPIYRWDGKKIALNRYEYESKSCRPNQ